ncbi:MAG: ABC transporter ATP-binding protein [Clostridia bacterium]|nr:ABC transporter ATP-binding protein [Clostridia bacterium]
MEVKHLSFAYPGRHSGKEDNPVLRDLSVTVSKGKVTTIIGANGCGKSTLLNLMTKNLHPDEGTILLDGRDIAEIRGKEYARKVAIVHQNNVAPPDVTVERLVSFGRTPYTRRGVPEDKKQDEEKIRWALDVMKLTDLKDQPVSELSGGQRQRAWIALALAQGTDFLFLDEPTTYLDVRYQLQILRLVRDLNERYGLTIVMVLHDINQSLCYSDEIIALKDGTVVAQGKPADVINETLIREVYDVDLQLVEVDGEPFVLPV